MTNLQEMTVRQDETHSGCEDAPRLSSSGPATSTIAGSGGCSTLELAPGSTTTKSALLNDSGEFDLTAARDESVSCGVAVGGSGDLAVSIQAVGDAASQSRRIDIDGMAKRAIDIVGASIGLLLVSPLWLLLWAKNAVDRSGPTLYAHNRVGQNGREFRCYKFRTMVQDADRMKVGLLDENKHDDSRTFKLERDPRVTPIGRWLRKFSVDEFPQLLNVLQGDMSLVGPRPPLPSEVRLYSSNDWKRLQVKPGLTCIWQVSGRSELAFQEQLSLDLEYIERRNFWFDLKLIALTVPAVLSCRGAW